VGVRTDVGNWRGMHAYVEIYVVLWKEAIAWFPSTG
jgi:hypothetical protein